MLASVLAITLMAACSSTPEETSAPDTSEAADTNTEDESTSGDEIIEIEYLSWDGGEGKKIAEASIADYMEQNPNIKVTLQTVTENYDSKINTLVAAGETPDIYNIAEYLANDWGEKGVAVDMAPLFSEFGVNMVETYHPGAIHQTDDKVYGISSGPVTTLLYFNKTMFDEAQVEYPSDDPHNPWTWDQLIEAAEKLTFDTSGNQPGSADFKPKQIKSYGFVAPTFWLFMQPLLYSADAGFANEDGTATGLNSDGGRAVLTGLHDAINVNQVSPDAAVAKTLPGMTQAFNNNQVAMAIDGIWMLPNFMAEEVNFGVAPLPSFGTPSNITWAAASQISSTSEHPLEAAKVIEHLTNPNKNPGLLQSFFPPTLEYYNNPEKFDEWMEVGNFNDDFKKIIPTIMSDIVVVPEGVTLKNFNKLVGEIAQVEIDKYLAGSQDLDTTLANIETASADQWQGKWS